MANGQRPTPPAQPFGGTLGVIAIAFGVGVIGAFALDLHSHQCCRCDNRWWHLGAFNLGDERAHTCPCGETQWWKDGVPHAFRTPPAPLALPSRPFSAMSQEIRDFCRRELPSGTFTTKP